MTDSLTVLFYEYWPALLFLWLGGSLMMRGAKKRRDALVSRNTAAARQQGMDYAPPAGDDTNGGAIQGTHRFSGTTRGVAWTAEVTLLTPEVDDGLATRRHGSVRYTRWTAPGAGTGGGELLLMALPEGVHPQPAKPDPAGFFGGLIAKAALAAIQVYIRTNFGNARGNSLSITPESHLPLAADAFGLAFSAFGNRPDLLQRLSPDARDWLLKGCDGKAAFLWDSQGLSLTWPIAHMKPEEVASCAEYGAVLANLLGAVAKTPEAEAKP